MTETDEYKRARRRALAKYRFYVHTAIYAAVMVLLVIINLVTSPSVLWFIWPLIGWGFDVGLHGLSVFWLSDKSVVLEAMTEHELRHSRLSKPR